MYQDFEGLDEGKGGTKGWTGSISSNCEVKKKRPLAVNIEKENVPSLPTYRSSRVENQAVTLVSLQRKDNNKPWRSSYGSLANWQARRSTIYYIQRTGIWE